MVSYKWSLATSAVFVLIIVSMMPVNGQKLKKAPYLVKRTTPKPTPAQLDTKLTTIQQTPEPIILVSTSTESTSPSTQPPIVIVETSTPKLPSETTTTKPVAIETTTVKPKPLVESTTTLAPIIPVRETTSSFVPIVETTTPTPVIPEIESTTSTVAPVVTEVESTPGPVVEQETNGPVIRTNPPAIPTLAPVDFKCSGKSDGLYPDPKDKCSSVFYACVGSLARRLECGAGGLVFEPETGACERRQESFRCSGIRKTTLPTTPKRPPPPPAPIDCTKLDDGWYPDPKSKCSRVFYSCSNGIASRFDCPGKTYFDVETTACWSYDLVLACSGKRNTKPVVSPTSPKPKENIPIDCMNLASGSYPDPAKKCSNIYYVCSNGDGFKRECPKGLYFDDKTYICDFFEEVFACTGKSKPRTKGTPAPVPSPASLPSNEFNCTNKKNGSYLPESQKCSNYYFRCVGNFSYKLTCPAGLFYDLENDACDRYMNVFTCSGKRPSPRPKTSPQPVVIEKLPVDCSKSADGDYPDPEKKCSSTYYTCSNYLGSRRQCAHGTFFDKNSRLCDSREYVVECGGKPRPATKPSTKRPIPSVPYKCENRNDGNYKAGKCDSKYYSCSGGVALLALCPDGTFYDSELDQCGYKEEIPACGGVRPKKS